MDHLLSMEREDKAVERERSGRAYRAPVLSSVPPGFEGSTPFWGPGSSGGSLGTARSISEDLSVAAGKQFSAGSEAVEREQAARGWHICAAARQSE